MTALQAWNAPAPESQVLALLPVALAEARRHPLMLASVFAMIALLALAIGLLLPSRYTSTTTILVEESNIIGPLMEGRAVPTAVANRAGISREVAFSRRIMDVILRTGGWLDTPVSPIEQERLIEQIKGRTRVSQPRENLIQIAYTDSEASRAYAVTKRFAELVIEETLATKERESRAAYDFIDTQVAQYHRKLTDAEAKLERYRRSNPDARSGIEADVNARIGELRRLSETSRMEMNDLRSQEATLRAQLSGETEIVTVETRSSRLLARLAELQADREGLLVGYTEQHPDVTRVSHQIEDVQEQLRRDEARPRSGSGSVSADAGPVVFNPLHGELRSRLAETRSSAAAASSRVATAQSLLGQELARSSRIASSESSLAELTRDYEVNRDLYQDLLRRRENARVSMNLDAEGRGLSFRIQEPAQMPLRGSGLRLMNVAGGGLLLALLAPIGLVFARLRFDPRIRSPRQLERGSSVPLLTVVPPYRTRREERRQLADVAMGAGIVVVVLLTYGLAYGLKQMTT